MISLSSGCNYAVYRCMGLNLEGELYAKVRVAILQVSYVCLYVVFHICSGPATQSVL